MQLPMIPQDKANHFAYGAAIATLAFTAAVLLGWRSQASALALLATALVAAAKEALDYFDNRRAIAAGLTPPHSVSLSDALATVAGAFPVAIAGLLLR